MNARLARIVTRAREITRSRGFLMGLAALLLLVSTT